MPLINFPFLIAMESTSSTILTRSGEGGQPCNMPRRKTFSFEYQCFLLTLVNGFNYIEESSFNSHLVENFFLS